MVVFCLVVVVASACSTTSTSSTTTSPSGQGSNTSVVVEYVQSALTQLGYLNQVNGTFDHATVDGLRSFQKANHLPATGELNARTALVLSEKSPATKRYAVLALQTELTELGYFSGLIDGTWGPETKRAVEGLQRSAGIDVDGDVGEATLVALDDQYRRRVVVPDTASDATSPVSPSTTAPPSTTQPAPITSTQITDVQRQLAALGYLPGAATGKPDVATASAVLAYQKRNGLQRDGDIGPQVIARLMAPQAAGPRSTAPGPRVEVDLDRQILFFINAQGAVTTVNISSGSGTTYKEPGGGTAVAYTPTGHFTVLRKINANEKAPLGSLYRPMYFTGGWAIHGSPSVPAYPASHGCVRVANWNQDVLFPELPVGSPVWVYGTSLGSPKGAEPGF